MARGRTTAPCGRHAMNHGVRTSCSSVGHLKCRERRAHHAESLRTSSRVQSASCAPAPTGALTTSYLQLLQHVRGSGGSGGDRCLHAQLVDGAFMYVCVRRPRKGRSSSRGCLTQLLHASCTAPLQHVSRVRLPVPQARCCNQSLPHSHTWQLPALLPAGRSWPGGGHQKELLS